MPVTGLFHVLGWGLPYAVALAGGDLVLPGHSNDPPTSPGWSRTFGVTKAAAVPTVWNDFLPLFDGARPAVAARAADRRRARAAGADPPLRRARHRRRPGLGHDRDVAERDDGAHRGHRRRDAARGAAAGRRGRRGAAVGRRAGGRAAGARPARGEPPTTAASRSPAAGCAPATSRRSTPTARSSSSTAPRTSSSPAASGSARRSSRARSPPTRASSRPRSSRSPTSAGASGRSRSWRPSDVGAERSARVPARPRRQVVDPRAVRVRRRDPAHRGRQVRQARAQGALRPRRRRISASTRLTSSTPSARTSTM